MHVAQILTSTECCYSPSVSLDLLSVPLYLCPGSQNKLERLTDENYVNMTTLQEERKELLALKETMQLYIRQLEQSNDDLERGKRCARMWSIRSCDASVG